VTYRATVAEPVDEVWERPEHAPFSIRPAGAQDAPALVDLARAVGREPEGWLVTTSEWRSVADERRYLKALRRFPDAAVYVAERPAGRIVGRLSLARDPHPGSAHVADLGLMVAHDQRRRGIGSALLRQAVEWARTLTRHSGSSTSRQSARRSLTTSRG
jgi:RimJ/RimL family protein N-acetyltransferase